MTIGTSLVIQKVGSVITMELNDYVDVLNPQLKKKSLDNSITSFTIATIVIY